MHDSIDAVKVGPIYWSSFSRECVDVIVPQTSASLPLAQRDFWLQVAPLLWIPESIHGVTEDVVFLLLLPKFRFITSCNILV